MDENSDSETSIKTAVADPVRAPGGVVTWSAVVGALGRDESRSYAMNLYRGSMFSADDFTNQRNRKAREALAGALTRTEDWIEYDHPRWTERESIKAVRRRLEWELWP